MNIIDAESAAALVFGRYTIKKQTNKDTVRVDQKRAKREKVRIVLFGRKMKYALTRKIN